MNVPPLVWDRLDGESVLSGVALGGDDGVFFTPTHTLVYRAEGLLSDETVAVYPHDVDRLDVSQGRRKATFELSYVDTDGKFTVPANCTDDILTPLFDGILTAAGVIDTNEQVREAYRFSELTVVVTDGRLLKHIGGALWDHDYEDYPFPDVTGLDVEEGSVATQLVVEVDGRPNRVKVPSQDAPSVEQALETAVFKFHDVGSVVELREKQGVVDDPAESQTDAFEESGIEPLVSSDAETDADGESDDQRMAGETTDKSIPDADIQSETGFNTSTASSAGRAATADAPVTSTSDISDVVDRLEQLERTVERQSELVEAQQETIQTLVDELRRGR